MGIRKYKIPEHFNKMNQHIALHCIFLSVIHLTAVNGQTSGRLILLSEPPEHNIITFYDKYDTGGNTSVAHDTDNIFKWSGSTPYRSESWGYFTPEGKEIPYIKRDRDLGQTFRIESNMPYKMVSVTVRLGFGTNVVRPEMYGKELSLQLFEVSGNPVLNNNGSGPDDEAFHGFPHNRGDEYIDPLRDDFFEGETYKTILVIRGFHFPWKKDFGIINDTAFISPDDQRLKGKYLKFLLPDGLNVILEPGKTYAFLIMIDKSGKNTGFTLANNYMGSYEAGHAIRRDGNGVFPPVPADPLKDFTDPANRKAMESAHFPSDFNKRISIQPGTNGYPDVDTWRDLVFVIEAVPAKN